MRFIPLISHRLFVAAIGSEGTTPAEPVRNEKALSPPPLAAKAISLELLSTVKSMPSDVPRRLIVARDQGSS